MNRNKLLSKIKSITDNEEIMIFPFINLYIKIKEEKNEEIQNNKYIKTNNYLAISTDNNSVRIKLHEIDKYLEYEFIEKESLERILECLLKIRKNK